MRLFLCSALLTAAIASLAAAASAPPSPVTIVLDFQGPRSDRSVVEMKREFEAVMKDTGVAFRWALRQQVKDADHLVLVRFKGKCRLEPVGYLYDERGSLAFTYSTDGEVQPFAEVACDKVTASVRSAMAGRDFSKADLLLGRALGRVLAHEIVHILGKSTGHGESGVEKPALTGSQLIAPELRLDPADVNRPRWYLP